ncbi:MAG: amidohydrolase family protein [Pseudomonadota bacterium]
MNLRTLVTCSTLLFAANAAGETIAIVGADIHTLAAEGSVRGGTLLIIDGVVTALGPNIAVPDGAEVIDANGLTVTPGLVDVAGTLGVEEVSLEESTVDFQRPAGGPAVAFSLTAAVNPASTLIAIARTEGVTHAVVAPAPPPSLHTMTPRASPFAGQATLIQLGTEVGFVLDEDAAVFVELGELGSNVVGGSRAAALANVDAAFALAAEHQADIARGGDGVSFEQLDEIGLDRADLAVLNAVRAGDLPLVIGANRASDLRQVIELALRHGVRAAVRGGAEAWRVADELAAAAIPVIVYPTENLPSRFESLDATLANAARLSEAGVTVIIGERSSHNVGNLRQGAGNAVASGLPWIEGLAAITAAPAALVSDDGTLGRIVAGEPASLVVWDGDPLDVGSFAQHVFIEGHRIPGVSRQTLLRDRYHPDQPTGSRAIYRRP